MSVFSTLATNLAMDIQAERSRLLNRQKKDRSDLEKTVKTKKGAFKTAAQEQLSNLIEEQERELIAFDKQHGGAVAPATAAPKVAEEPSSPKKKKKSSKDLKDSLTNTMPIKMVNSHLMNFL